MRLLRPGAARRRLPQFLAAAVLACAPALASAQQQGTITGRVTAAVGGAPLVESRVFVVGTNTVTSTNAEGRYTLRVSPGTHDIRVLRVGYSEQKRAVTVASGGTTTLDFALNASVVKLTEIVTTATGETQRKVELGNSVQTLGDIAQKVEQAPVTNLADLMVAKAPGVQVLAGNMTGSAPVVRIRGIKSLSLSSEPIYVIDGVRMNSSVVGLNTGGTQGSLLNVINPEEIADIEIVKGPSAATLYGTDAANGVIVITTKKGLAGPARWTGHAGYGTVEDKNDYPKTYAIFGHTTAGAISRCNLQTVATGACIPDSTTSYDLLRDPGITPLVTGNTKQLGLQASGGSDIVRYFVSGDYEGERGPLEMPSFSQRFLDSTGNAMREEWLHPENFSRKSFRGNLNAALNPKLDLAFNSGYTRTFQQLPPVDNNSASFLYNALNNPGFKPTVACQALANRAACLGYSDKGQLGEELGGYGFYTPGNLFQRINSLAVDRFITSANSAYRPLTWLSADATVGFDIAARDNVAMCRFAECQNSGTTRQGFVFDARTTDHNISAKGSVTGTYQATSALNLRTTIGTDYVNQQTEFVSGEGDNLPPGAQTAGAGAIQFASSQFTRANKTLGYYAQEQAALNDRLFITLAARRDQNSAFGTKFQNVIYPKASVSYIVSEEPFFPKLSFLDQLRLRASYGASGVQPGSTTALQTYSANSANLNANGVGALGLDTPGLLAAALGNPNLKPERSTEREMGFETKMFDSRVNFDFTYYNNVTKDALIDLPIASSSGASSTGLTTLPSVTTNIGSVRNTGIEASVTTTLLDTRSFGWDLTIGGSHNTNKIESLGEQACVINTTDCLTGSKPNATIGTGANRDSVGMPIRGIYARPYTYSDVNGNGIIEPSEVTVDPNVAYMGNSIPRDLLTVQNGFDLFNKKLHLNVLLDYKGGFSLMNQTTQFYCLNTNTCYDETHAAAGSSFPVLTQSGTSSLEDQARLVAQRYKSPTTTAGYWENGQFWRLREVGATLTVPQAVSNFMQARDASITLSGRNLHVWTKYKGTDPEANYSTGNVQTDFSTLAPPTYYSVRLNLHY